MMLGWSSFLRKEISLMACLGIPSSSFVKWIFLRAFMHLASWS